jgi:O-antigen/teichoic acid export membrane protein
MIYVIRNQLAKLGHGGSFIRNVSITSFWNILIICVQLILSPIVTRLYSPAEYGIFALVSAIITPIAMIGTFRYADAIVICETKRDRNNTVALSLGLIAFISLATFITILLAKGRVLNFIEAIWLGNFVYLIPIIVCFSGMIEILLCLNVSDKKFSYNGFAGFAMNLSARGFTAGYTLFMPAKALGLIVGEFMGKSTALILLVSSLGNLKQKLTNLVLSVSFSGIVNVIRLFQRFPLYVLPVNIINSLSSYLPLYFLKTQFALSVVGSYALASSLLEIINRLLPYSVASIFFPKAVELKQKSMSELMSGLYKLYWMMLVSSLIIFTGAALLAEVVFPFAFGKSWVMAGTFISLLSIQYAFNFVSLPISETYKVVGQQKLLFLTTMVSIALKIIALLILSYFLTTEKVSIFWISLSGAVGSIIPIVGIFFFFKFKLRQIVGSLLATFIFLAVIIVLMNFS